MTESKTELLTWLNDLLQLQYQRIEQCGSGAAYCQILDSIYRDLPLSRVRFSSKVEYDHVSNFKILQAGFNHHNIEKSIEIDKLVKCRFNDNLDFLQWMKKYWDAFYPGGGYDAAARRALSAAKEKARSPTRADAGKPIGQDTRVPPDSTQSDGHRTKTARTPKEQINTASSSRSIGPSGTSPIRRPGTQAAVGNSRPRQANNASGSASSSRTHSRSSSAANINAPAPAPVRMSVAAPSVPMITRDEHDVIVGGLNRKVADLRVVSDTLERERNFYYLKLRDLEVATFEQHEKNDQTADPEAREAMDLFIIMIQNILYSTEDGFVAPTPRAASKHVHSVAASSSSLFNVRLSVRPITAANPATASNTAINTPLTPSQSPPPADNSTISRAPSISHTWQSSPPLPAVPGTSSPRSHSTNVPPSPSPTGVILRSRPSSPPSASASPASRQHSLVPALADTPDIFNPPLAETPTDNRDASTTPTPINNVSEVAHRTPSASPPPANDNPSRPSSRSSSRSAIAPPPAPPVASTIIGVASPSRRNSPATLGLLAHLPPLPPSGGSSVASLRESSTSNAELAQSVQPQRSGNASPDAGGDDIEAVQVHPSVETDEPSDGDVGQPEQAEAEEQEDEQEREVEGGGRQFLAIARSRAGLGDVSVPNLLLVNQDEQGDADDDAEAEGEEEREKEKEDVEVAGGGVQEKEMEGLPELPVKEEVASDVV